MMKTILNIIANYIVGLVLRYVGNLLWSMIQPIFGF